MPVVRKKVRSKQQTASKTTHQLHPLVLPSSGELCASFRQRPPETHVLLFSHTTVYLVNMVATRLMRPPVFRSIPTGFHNQQQQVKGHALQSSSKPWRRRLQFFADAAAAANSNNMKPPVAVVLPLSRSIQWPAEERTPKWYSLLVGSKQDARSILQFGSSKCSGLYGGVC